MADVQPIAGRKYPDGRDGHAPFFSEGDSRLAQLCEGRRKVESVAFSVTASRETLDKPELAEAIKTLRAFGVSLIVDTFWCVIRDPMIKPHVRTVLTNSGKYAHYGPGMVERDIRFASIAECMEAARSGRISKTAPRWLTNARDRVSI
ncbi:aconitase X [Paraburkholderia sp. EG285A]|uniref:aconitase X n=1 Tax=Paraburkholderia sp. EG285A TaxID=3237009 RepID=UPI0034D36901